jgi:hypothetical protein
MYGSRTVVGSEDRGAMRWLRQRWGSYLALAALVFQLALTFGHVHLEQSFTGNVAVATTVGNAADAPSSPDSPDHDHCATCALIHLAQTLLTPDAPILPHPVAFERPPRIAATAGLTAPPPARFRARAPPLA